MVQTDRVFRGTVEAETSRRAHEASLAAPAARRILSATELRDLALAAGADDVGFVEVERPALAEEVAAARRLLPSVETYAVLVRSTNPPAVRSGSRAVANAAWHANHGELDHVAAHLVDELAARGVASVFCPIGFPMDPPHEPGARPWDLALKPIAVEAGLGHMGVNRNVIHPRLGNFILISVVLVAAPVDAHGAPLDYNPCAGCNLCVAACPVGAVRHDDDFDFFACLTHNYREFLFGFEDWVHTVADARSADEYAAKFDSDETRSMWQSLGFGPNYKAAYCQAVCPAGDDVIGPYLADRAAWRRDVVKPLVDRVEPVYVTSGTRAERVARRRPQKLVRYVDYRPGVSTLPNLALALGHHFDPRRVPDAQVTVRFQRGAGELTATVADGRLTTGPAAEHAEPDVVVDLLADDFIGLVQGRPIRASDGGPGHRVHGDPRALGVLLACLGQAAPLPVEIDERSAPAG